MSGWMRASVRVVLACVWCACRPRGPRRHEGAYRVSTHLPLQGSQQRRVVHSVLHQLDATLGPAVPRRWEGPRWEERWP